MLPWRIQDFPLRCDSFPFVGVTLVVALPLLAAEIGRGPRRESHAISGPSTGAGSVSTEEGTHKGCPYGIRNTLTRSDNIHNMMR